MICLSTEDTVTTKEANGEQSFSQVLNTDHKMQKKVLQCRVILFPLYGIQLLVNHCYPNGLRIVGEYTARDMGLSLCT